MTMSGLISPTTRTSMSAGSRSRLGHASVLAVPAVARHRRGRQPARPLVPGPAGRRRRGRRAGGAGRGRSSRGTRRGPPASIVAASAQTDRPTRTPLAPASQAVATWASNVASSTPPDRRTHGSRGRRVELGAGLAPASAVRHRRVVRELGLEDVATDRGQAPGGLDDDPPARLAGRAARPRRARTTAAPRRARGRRRGSRRRRRRRGAPGPRRSAHRGGSRRGAWRRTRPSASPSRRSSHRAPG